MREFVAIKSAQVIPLSARTGYGLDDLRTSLAAALGHESLASGRSTPSVERPETPKSGSSRKQNHADSELSKVDAMTTAAGPGSVSVSTADLRAEGDEPEVEVVMAEAPEHAATATVLDYRSSAKTGKVLVRADLVLLSLRLRCCSLEFTTGVC